MTERIRSLYSRYCDLLFALEDLDIETEPKDARIEAIRNALRPATEKFLKMTHYTD